MLLYHERDRPRPAALAKSDEEECFTSVGRRKGIWLTTAMPSGANVMTFETAEDSVVGYEVTRPGEESRSFVVPFHALQDTGALG